MRANPKINTPLITVLMPVYNAELYLNEAIESILNQTFKDFEFLIINDGSTDKSEEIILSYIDPRIRYIKNELNIQLIATLNKGIELSKGKYIARMDADDISLPYRLEKQIKYMDANPKIAICGTWFYSFGNRMGVSKYKLDNDNIRFRMLYQCHLVHATIIIKKDVIDGLTKKFDSEFIHAEDYELFVRISEKYLIANIPDVLLGYRIHDKSVSNIFKTIQNENSNLIRIRQFKNMGYNISTILLDDYIQLNYQNYTNLKSTSTAIKDMLEQIVKKNNESHFMNKMFLSSNISLLWFHYCYNTKQKKLFYSSILSKHESIGLINKIKFLIKG